MLTNPHLWVGVWVVGWMGGLICGSMETTWGKHEDNVETTLVNMGTTGMWRPHGDNVETTWDVGTTWETTWGQHEDNV